jgi:hypothetical protein
MEFGEIGIELAKQRADYLRAEGRRARRNRRSRAADSSTPAGLQARTGQLVHWLQHGQLGAGIDLSDAPVTARGRCA